MMLNTSLSATLWLLCAVAVAQTNPVARVLEIQGSVTIRQPDGKTRTAAIYSTVYAGDRIEGGQNALVALGFSKDGHLEKFQAPFTGTAAEDGCQPPGTRQKRAVSALHHKAAKWISDLPAFTAGGIEIARGLGDLPPRLCPIVDSVVTSLRPAFAWPSMATASAYTVKLYRGNSCIWTVTTPKTTAEYSGGPDLVPGKSYEWEVLVVPARGDSPAVQGRFRVASKSQRAEAAELKELTSETTVPWLAVAAVRYRQAGMLTEAIECYERLTKVAPDTAAFYASLATLYQAAGRRDDAEASLRRAEQLGFVVER
jgi:hypothetical protein